MKFFPVLLVLISLFWAKNLFAQNELPLGSHPPALQFEHFPNRLFAFVWRNWNLVSPEKMGETLGCQPEKILEIASAMGLDQVDVLPDQYKKQIYITLLRRNWHLLPYEQLLTLVDMEVRELEFALKEDDFLFYKFGNLKPNSPKVTFHPPNERELARAQEIKKLVHQHVNNNSGDESIEPLFHFIKDLSEVNSLEKDKMEKPSGQGGLRFIYSYFGVFGDPLLSQDHDPFPDGLLQKLSAKGINGVWMHVVLNQLAPGGKHFPEFGENHKVRLANLKKIAQRAKRYGIDIYLYINEPRAMPLSFFDKRKELAGIQKGDVMTLCTSDERVRNWISESLSHVFEQVPELGGVFTITASENLTNCVSHGGIDDCPRCSKRAYADILAEVNQVIADGVHRSKPAAKVIAWDWGWHGHGDARDVIEKLPEDVWLMSVSEWGKKLERGGVATTVGEYSISAVGPGPRAQNHWEAARSRGLKTVAKVQFNNTWELSALPWLPVMDLVAQHASKLAQIDIDGYMLSWTLGAYPSPNLEIARKFTKNPKANVDEVLNELALERYGAEAMPAIRKAWTAFSEAFQEYPYHQKVVYSAPQQYGPANLLFLQPTGYNATMVGFPYDDLQGWSGPFPPKVLAGQFAKVAEGWEKGLKLMEEAFAGSSSGENRNNIASDLLLAKAAYLHFLSVAQQAHFILLRDRLKAKPSNATLIRKQMRAILEQEIQTALDLFEISRRDSRVGFEASNQYYYVPQDLMEKVINCKFLIRQLAD
ncbi:MAG: hypothetical protein WD431_15835 [Cyclobacteriaceae bacterium]